VNPREAAVLRDRVARARLARAGDPKIVGAPGNAHRQGKPNGRLLTVEVVEAARRSLSDGLPLADIARMHWRRLGFASAASCERSLRRALGFWAT